MQLRVKLHAHTIADFSKEGVLSKIKSGGRSQVSSSEFGRALCSHYRSRGSDFERTIRVYSLQKNSRKSTQTNKTKKVTIGGVEFTQRIKKRVSNSFWSAVYYDIPVSLLKVLGKEVEQGNRTWKFI